MKKSILNIGKTLNKEEQRLVNGGNPSLSCYRKQEGDSCGFNGQGVCVNSNDYSGNNSDFPYLYCSMLA
jgi:hypothetical protein